jgi:hypothetical protein
MYRTSRAVFRLMPRSKVTGSIKELIFVFLCLCSSYSLLQVMPNRLHWPIPEFYSCADLIHSVLGKVSRLSHGIQTVRISSAASDEPRDFSLYWILLFLLHTIQVQLVLLFNVLYLNLRFSCLVLSRECSTSGFATLVISPT